MYSLVLMAALSTGANTPGFFFNWGCNGCYGCNGCGGFLFGCWGCNGCYGSSCYGCYGRSYSCNGCYGSAYQHCYGCTGYVQPVYSCHGCYGTAVPVPPAASAKPAAHTSEKPPEPAAKPAPTPRAQPSAALPPNRGRFILEVPADAKVFIDEQPTKTSNITARSFLTPELEEGYDYFYVVRAETVRDGRLFADTQRIVIQPGKEVRVSLDPAVAARPADDQWTSLSKK